MTRARAPRAASARRRAQIRSFQELDEDASTVSRRYSRQLSDQLVATVRQAVAESRHASVGDTAHDADGGALAGGSGDHEAGAELHALPRAVLGGALATTSCRRSTPPSDGGVESHATESPTAQRSVSRRDSAACDSSPRLEPTDGHAVLFGASPASSRDTARDSHVDRGDDTKLRR